MVPKGTGSGLCSSDTELTVSLGIYASIFEAEVLAINLCAKTLIDLDKTDKRIFTMSESQAAIKAIRRPPI